MSAATRPRIPFEQIAPGQRSHPVRRQWASHGDRRADLVPMLASPSGCRSSSAVLIREPARSDIRPRRVGILRASAALDDRPVDQPWPLTDRVVAVLHSRASCAFCASGHRGGARCGFASTSSRAASSTMDRRVSTSRRRALGASRPGRSWVPVRGAHHSCRGRVRERRRGVDVVPRGAADPSRFGVDGVPHVWGIAEVRGNAIRDLAALNKVEMLPWDAWGRMMASYDGDTGRTTTACSTPSQGPAHRTTSRLSSAWDGAEDLAVPGSMLN